MGEDTEILSNLFASNADSKPMADQKAFTNLRPHRNPASIHKKIKELKKPSQKPNLLHVKEM
jgi:hypothetical protein